MYFLYAWIVLTQRWQRGNVGNTILNQQHAVSLSEKGRFTNSDTTSLLVRKT